MDNVFIERLWSSLKYEYIYLQEFDYATQLRTAIATWFEFYNNNRPHSTFAGATEKRFIIEAILLLQCQRIANLQLNFKYEIYP